MIGPVLFYPELSIALELLPDRSVYIALSLSMQRNDERAIFAAVALVQKWLSISNQTTYFVNLESSYGVLRKISGRLG